MHMELLSVTARIFILPIQQKNGVETKARRNATAQLKELYYRNGLIAVKPEE